MQKYLMMVAVFLVVSMARAGDGTWISTSNGNWGASENWAGGTNADGSGFTADFTTIDIPSDVTVTLDTNKTIGVLKFGDTGVGTAGSWILAGDNTLTLAGTPTITVNALGAGKSVTISSSVAGSSGLTKTGVGTLTLNGSNTFSGSMTQADGWMYLSGSATNALNALTLGNQNSGTITPVLSITSGTVTYSGRMGLGGATGARGIINISGTASVKATGDFIMFGGNGGGANLTSSGVINQSGGIFNVNTSSGVLLPWAGNAYGAYILSGGTLSATSSWNIDNQNTTYGIFSQSGGIATFASNFNINQNSTGGAMVDISGGTLTHQTAGNLMATTGAGSTGVLTVRGTGFLSERTGNFLVTSGNNTCVGIVNLLTGGTIEANKIQKTASTSAKAILNCDGGTLKVYSVNGGASFLTGLDNMFVYPGGLTVDTAGQSVTIGQPLTVPAGYGVGVSGGTITVANGGTGYIAPPVVAFAAPVSGAAATGVAVINATGTVSGILITSPGSGYTSNQTVAVTFNAGNNSANAATTVAPGFNVSAGAVNAGGGLVKVGAGTLTLSGTNTYSGTTTISSGVLKVSGAGMLASSNVVTGSTTTFDVSAQTPPLLASNQTLYGDGFVTGTLTAAPSSMISAGTDGVAGTNTFNNSVTMAVGSMFALDVGTNATFGNDAVVVAGTVTMNGTVFRLKALGGTAPLDTTTDYVLVSASSLVGTPSSMATWIGATPGNASSFTVQKSGNTVVLRYTAAIPPSVTSVSFSPSSLMRAESTVISAVVTAGDFPINTVVADTSLLGGSGSLALVFDGAGHYTNTIMVGPDTLPGAQLVTVTATDDHANPGTGGQSVTILGRNQIWTGGAGDNTWSNAVNWVSGLWPLSGDSLVFSGTSQLMPNMQGSYAITSVTFSNNAGSFIITNALNTLTLSGGVTNLSANPQTLDVPVALAGSQTINAAASDVVISRAISGVGAGLTKAGNGVLALSGVNTYDGGTTINGGTLTLSGAGRLGNGNYGGAVSLAAATCALNFDSTAAQTFGGVISGNGSLIKNNQGTLTLSGANSYTGGTTLVTGMLIANHATALGSPTSSLAMGTSSTGSNPVTLKIDAGITSGVHLANIFTSNYGTSQTIIVNSGAALGGNSDAINATFNLDGTVPLTIQGTNTGGHPTPEDVYGRFVGSGIPSGSTALILDGTSASLRLSFNVGATRNTFTGDVVVKGAVSTQNQTYNGNTAANQNIGLTNNNVTVNAGATWTLVWGGETMGALNGSGNINLNCQSALNNIGLTFGNTGVGGSYAGSISGGFGVTKIGSGVQVLSGVSTYAIGTAVNGGTLMVNNASGSGTGTGALNISSNATLCGTGKVSGVTTVAAGGFLSPGDPGANSGIGQFTVNTNVTLAAGSTMLVQVTTNGACDQLVSAGTATISGANLSVSVLNDSIPLGTKFVVLTATNIVGTFSGFPEGGGVTIGARRFVVSYPGATNVVLETKSTGFVLLVQ